MADKFSESSKMKRDLTALIESVIKEKTRDCFRVYKATVTTAPNGTSCGVKLIGDETEISIPYSSKVSSVSTGDVVWVATIFGDFRNAIVWETSNFN